MTPPFRKSRPPFGFLLLAAILGGSLVMAYFGWRTLATSRDHAHRLTELHTRNLAQAASQSITASIGRIDQALLTVTDAMESNLSSGPAGLDRMRRILATQERLLPEGLAIRVTDNEGTVILNNPTPDPFANFKDRPYFQFLKAHPGAGLSVTKPIMGLFAKTWLITFVRRYNLPNGRFGGVVVVPVLRDTLQKALAGFDLGRGGMLTLRDSEGGFVARHPVVVKGKMLPMGDRTYSQELQAIVASDVEQATYRATTPYDQTRRTFTFRRIATAPFFLVASLAEEDYLVPWREERLKTILILGTSLLGLWIMAGLLWRFWRVRERDLTDRKAHERELERMNRLYEMLSQLGRCLVQVQSREGLLQEICTIVADRGGFRLAWVGWVDPETGAIVPVAKAGEAVAYLEGLTIWADARPEGQGPTGICIRQNRSYVCQDFGQDPATVTWRQRAQTFGLQASASVPIACAGQVVAALVVYAGEAGGFQDREVALLEETAAHIAFGLNHLAAEAQRKQFEAECSNTQKMESLGSLAGGVAHDMNNVLGAILGLASLHASLAPEGSPLHKSMETIARACQRGATLVKGLLGFARPGLLEEKVVDLNVLVTEEIALLERTTLQKVRMETDLAAEPMLIKGEAGALSHALMNLCVNAVDAMPGGGTLTVRTWNEGDGTVALEVRDTGTGMPKGVLAKALDPFFTTKPLGKGTGLGLAIVYGTVKAHHGKVELQSELDHGTRVTLRFPACLTSGLTVDERHPAHPQGHQGSLRILLIDDDELVQHSIRTILEALGHTITTASNGEEALAKLRGGCQPEFVILDMNMPGLDGAGTLPPLRLLCPKAPVLLITGREDPSALDLVETYPNLSLLLKPFRMEELLLRLEGQATASR